LGSDIKIQTVWAYEVRQDFIGQFEKAYGPDGDWAKLFKKCSGYIESVLLQDLDIPNRFIVIDCWQSESAYSSMREIIAPEYEYLDKRCKPYSDSESHLGVFETIDEWNNSEV
jgi:hypothetical protein